MLKFDLKALLTDYESRTGLRLSYDELSEMTSVSVDTLKSLASRESYNATLHIIEKICTALGVNPIQYFLWRTDVEENGVKINR